MASRCGADVTAHTGNVFPGGTVAAGLGHRSVASGQRRGGVAAAALRTPQQVSLEPDEH